MYSRSHRFSRPLWAIAVFALITVVGLYYVKWSPYYGRAFTAAETHSIGRSILAGSSAVLPAPSLRAAVNYALVYGRSIWEALVLGLLLGSAVQVLIPRRWVVRLLGGTGAASVVAGGLLAVPTMMCTCCSAPVINGLRAARAAPGSTVAFWLGNTMLNPATLVFMGFVLGWRWAGLRLALGCVMVFGLGWILSRMSAARGGHLSPPAEEDESDNEESGWLLSRWVRALARMTWQLLPEYLVIVLLLGAARAWLFPALDFSVDNSLSWIVGLAVAGTLFVIPTAGEVPIVQAALALGMAAGPAAALLVTLPPISLPSLAMVGRSFRPAELATLIVGVVALGIAAGGAAIAIGL